MATIISQSITDRQERIPGFRQIHLNQAKVAVFGAGRTGNEVIKNLALTGFGSLFTTDMDHVSDTNLPGTVLFSKADVGDSKARLVADGFSRLHVGDHVVDWFDSDICYTLGEGVLNQYDLFINCLDNLETRLYLCRIAKLLGKPCIDTGIDGFNWTLFASSGDKDCACYACTMTAIQEDAALSRVRNSCDVTLKKAASQGHAATIITSAAQVGGAAVERAIKILHHRVNSDLPAYDPQYGRLIQYTSADASMRGFRFPVRPDCDNHISYADFGGVIETSLSAQNTVREVLEWAENTYGAPYYLSLLKDCAKIPNRAFVTTAHCKCCRTPIDVYRPQFTLADEDMLCESCKQAGAVPHFPSEAQRIFNFHLNGTDDRLLDLTLAQIGVPMAHILELDPEDESKDPIFPELSADLPDVLPNLCAAHGD